MNRILIKALWVLFAAALPNAASLRAEVAALLSADAPAYQDAVRVFQEAYGAPVPVLVAGKGPLPDGTRVVVTFGRRAAEEARESGAAVVACLAPGLAASKETRMTLISAMPPPRELMSILKEVQPRLEVLPVFWVSDAFDEYMGELEEAGKARGVYILPHKPVSADKLGQRLGMFESKPEAFWVLPDPALLTTVNAKTLLEYSAFNRVPFYVSQSSLVERGALVSFAPENEETARAAVQAVRQILAGGAVPSEIRPEAALVLNKAAFQNTFLDPPARVKVKKSY